MANAPKIQTPTIKAMEQNMQPIAFITDQFPDGLDVLVMPPNGLQPLGAARIPKGWMVVALPPGPLNTQLQMMLAQAVARMASEPGAVKAPGI